MRDDYAVPAHVESIKTFGEFPDGYIEREIAQLEKSSNRSVRTIEFHNMGDGNCRQVYTYHPVPFERIRRITGYLVGTLDRWNNAKRSEEKDRVKHKVEA